MFSSMREKVMIAITRRTFLAATGASLSASSVSTDVAASPNLKAMIAAHQVAYAEFHATVHRVGRSQDDCERADKVEQEALLTVCSYQATSRDDRRTKARYLLAVEARGELDLPQHMQAILHSAM
jgi:hypothetical protein